MEMNKVVLITGCSTGIGRDLAWRLARAGDTVVATAREAGALENWKRLSGCLWMSPARTRSKKP